MFKFLISLVVLAVIAGGLWWTGLLSKWVPSIPTYAALTAPKEAATTTQTPSTANTQQQQAPASDLPTATGDSSDAALLQDTTALDAQMSSLNTDNANAQGSLDDKPVSQEY